MGSDDEVTLIVAKEAVSDTHAGTWGASDFAFFGFVSKENGKQGAQYTVKVFRVEGGNNVIQD